MCFVATKELESERMIDLHRDLTRSIQLLLELLQDELGKASSTSRQRAEDQATEAGRIKRNDDLIRSTAEVVEDLGIAVRQGFAQFTADLVDIEEIAQKVVQDLEIAFGLFTNAIEEVRSPSAFLVMNSLPDKLESGAILFNASTAVIRLSVESGALVRSGHFECD